MLALFFVFQHVEDQGIHIPDQTVIKKGKQFSTKYRASFHNQGNVAQPVIGGAQALLHSKGIG